MADDTLKLKKRIIKNSFWSLISSTINRFGTLAFTIILARFLMPEGYGLYSLTLSIAMIFMTLTDVGVNNTFIRYISYSLEKEKDKVSSYYKYLLRLKFIISLLVSLSLFMLSYPLSYFIFNNSSLFLPLIISSIYIFIASLGGFYSNLFVVVEKLNYLSFKESINQTLKILFAFIVFSTIASQYQVVGIFLSLILIAILMLLFSLFYTTKLIPEVYKKRYKKIDNARVRSFLGYLTVATISITLFTYVDSIMLGLFVSIEYIGYYRAAFSLIYGILGFITFPNVILLPILTKASKSNTEKIFNKSLKYMSIIAIPAFLGLLVLRKYLIMLFFGYPYLPATLPLVFLSFLLLIFVYRSLFLTLYAAEEKTKIFAKLMIISTILNVILNYLFIKAFLLVSAEWATAGAAIATTTSWTVYLICSIYFSKKQMKLKISFNHLIRPIISGLSMFVALFLILKYWITVLNLFSGMCVILLGAIIYFFILFILGGINKEDIKLVKILFQRG